MLDDLKFIMYFCMYLESAGFSGKFVGASNINKDRGRTCRIDPSESCTKEELAEMYAIRDTYNWDQPDFWIPKVKDFKEQIFTVLPDAGKLQMAPILMAMSDEFLEDPTNMQTYWNALLANKPAWMNDSLATQIGEIAKACNIPLEVPKKVSLVDKFKGLFSK